MIHPKQKSPLRDWEREVDRLYTANTTTTDMERRMSTGIELQKIWVTELPWIYTVNRAVLYAYKNRFGNIKPRVVHPYTNFNGICEFVYVR
jgi:ABC-type transport system substrate-binding protein